MTTAHWTDDLANIIEAARIDDLPRPLCLSFTWTGDGHGQAHVTLVTDAEAARWEHSAAAELDARCTGHGRLVQTNVRTILASDEWEQHEAATPGMLRFSDVEALRRVEA